jgi:hypothetical protein
MLQWLPARRWGRENETLKEQVSTLVATQPVDEVWVAAAKWLSDAGDDRWLDVLASRLESEPQTWELDSIGLWGSLAIEAANVLDESSGRRAAIVDRFVSVGTVVGDRPAAAGIAAVVELLGSPVGLPGEGAKETADS